MGGGKNATTSLDLAKPSEAADVDCKDACAGLNKLGHNSESSDQQHHCYWTLATEDKTQDSEQDRYTATVQPDLCRLIVNITESLMRNVMLHCTCTVNLCAHLETQHV